MLKYYGARKVVDDFNGIDNASGEFKPVSVRLRSAWR